MGSLNTPSIWVTVPTAASVSKLSLTGLRLQTSVVGGDVQSAEWDNRDNVYFALRTEALVRKYSVSSGTQVNSFNVPSQPRDGTCDRYGNYWVVCKTGGHVVKFTLTGLPVLTIMFGGAAGSTCAVTDSNNNILVSNRFSDTITKIGNSGNILATYYPGVGPESLAIDFDDTLWVALADSHSVVKLSSTGLPLFTTSVSANSYPTGIGIDANSNAWVAQPLTALVTKLSSTGLPLLTLSVGGQPLGLAVDQDSNPWVMNFNNSQVVKYSVTGLPLVTVDLNGKPRAFSDFTGYIAGTFDIVTLGEDNFGGTIFIDSTATDEFDGQLLVFTHAIDEFSAQLVVLDVTTGEFDGQLSVVEKEIVAFDAKILVSDVTADEFDAQLFIYSATTDEFDGSVVVAAENVDEFDGQITVSTEGTDRFNGQLLLYSTTASEFDGSIAVATETVNKFDGHLAIVSTSSNLYDGRAAVVDTGTDLFDSALTVKSIFTDELDGRIYVFSSDTNIFNGFLIIEGTIVALFDGTIVVATSAADKYDALLYVSLTQSGTFDGVLNVHNVDTNKFDGHALLYDVGTALLDGKLIVVSTNRTRCFNGQIFVHEEVTKLFDAHLFVHEEIISLFDARLAILSTSLYVDNVNGSDITGDGSFSNRFASIAKALSEVVDEDTITVFNSRQEYLLKKSITPPRDNMTFIGVADDRGLYPRIVTDESMIHMITASGPNRNLTLKRLHFVITDKGEGTVSFIGSDPDAEKIIDHCVFQVCMTHPFVDPFVVEGKNWRLTHCTIGRTRGVSRTLPGGTISCEVRDSIFYMGIMQDIYVSAGLGVLNDYNIHYNTEDPSHIEYSEENTSQPGQIGANSFAVANSNSTYPGFIFSETGP